MRRRLHPLLVLLVLGILLSACQGPTKLVFSPAAGEWDDSSWDVGSWE